MDEEIRPVAQHGRVGAHAAAGLVDAPALAGGIPGPDERDGTAVARRAAKTPGHRLADDRRRGQILEADAIEDVLPRRQALDQGIGGEIGFGQRVDEHGAVDGLEAVGCRNLRQHARRPIGARPDHGGVVGDVAGLDAMGDERAIGGAAEIGPGDAADRGDRGRRRGRGQKPSARHGDAHQHGIPPVPEGGEDGGEFSQLHDSGSPASPLTVDIGQAPVARVQGPSRTPLGKLFFSVSI